MAQIILIVPNEKLVEFRTGFLAMCPIPIDNNSESETYGQPLFTELQWLKEWIRRDVIRAYKHGKRKLAQEAAQVDEGVVI